MRQVHLSRTEFLHWVAIQSGGGSEHLDPASLTHMRSSDVILAWPSDDERGTPLIAVKASELREFVAFVTTYIGSFSPFTAFFRIVAAEMLEFIPKPYFQRDRDDLLPLLGGLIADAALNAGNKNGRLTEIGLQSCYAAPSWVVTKAFALGYSGAMSDVALQRWKQVRGSLRTGGPHEQAREIDLLWRVAIAAIDAENAYVDEEHAALVTFISEIRQSITGKRELKSRFLDRLPSGGEITSLTSLSREDRVRALDRIYAQLASSSLAKMEIEACVGFVASLVGQGSFSYLQLALKYSEKFPLAPVWFGIFSAMHSDSDILVNGDCLGRRLLRTIDSSQDIWNICDSDFGYEEFLILNNEPRFNKIRTERGASIKVEVIPGVTGTFRTVSNPDSYERTTSSQVDVRRLDQARALAQELVGLLNVSGSQRSSISPDLFSQQENIDNTARKPRGKKRNEK